MIASILAGLLLLRTLVAMANALYRRGLAGTPTARPLVSVLIPARNEEATLPALLADLSAQTYESFEVIVWDDDSTDATRARVEEAGQRDPRIRVDGGIPLPAGWLGKLHGCDALGRRARGELLVFVDADVRLSPEALSRVVARFERRDLSLLSLFPRQLRFSAGEEAVVPVMTWTLLSLLPLALVKALKSPALAAANGQFLAIDGPAYRRLWPHERLRAHPAEDVALARLFKKEGLAVELRLAGDEVSCRMYSGGGAALAGFARNVVHWTGGNPFVLLALAVSLGATPFVLVAQGGWAGLALWVGASVLLEVAVVVASGDALLPGLMWAPTRTAVFLGLAVRSLALRWTRRVVLWKGRSVAP